MSAAPGTSLPDRVAALDAAIDVADGHLAPELVEGARSIAEKVAGRLGQGTERTVVAIAGPTGVGKSSLFNALAGAEVSTPGVRRPTTGAVHAAVWGAGDARILDWLAVDRRHHVPSGSDAAAGDLDGLVLLDLPDFDSIESDNRAEVARIIELVDQVVWVTDPQKYADEVFHDGFVRPLAGHAGVMSFVVNRIDLVRAGDAAVVADDLTVRLRADGVSSPDVFVTSVTTGAGIDEVRTMIADVVAERRAMTERLVADVRAAASMLTTDDGTAELSKRDRAAFVDRLTVAAGGDRIADIVAAEHRHLARRRMGWPPAKLVARWRRRHPIADLPRVSANRVGRSEIDVAVRDVAEAAADGAGPVWTRALRAATAERADELAEGLTALASRTARDRLTPPRWWSAVNAVQTALTVAALVGAVWLIAVAVAGGFFRIDTDPLLIDTPGWEWIPVPSLLVLGGLLISLLVALVVRIPVAVAARRRGAAARRSLRRAVAELADRTVVDEIDRTLAARHDLRSHLRVATA